MSTTAASDASPDTVARAFLRGLREPSALSLATTIGVAAALFLVLTIGISEELMMSPHARWFAIATNESPVHITSTLLRMRGEPPGAPRVCVFGSSSVRSSVDGPALESELRQATGAEVRVVQLAADSQRPLEALAMLEAVPAGTRGIVVVGVGGAALNWSADYVRSLFDAPRIAMRFRTLDDDAARLGVATPSRCGVYVWDNRRFFLRRLGVALSNALQGREPPYVPMQFLGRKLPARGELERRKTKRWGEWLDETKDAQVGASLGVLDRLADAVAARGMRLVLVEDVIHPEYRESPDVLRVVDASRAAIRGLAARRGVAYLDLQERARVTGDDFADAAHLRTADAVARFTRELSGELAPALREIAQQRR